MLTFDWLLTTGSALLWNFRSVSTPSCGSAQRGIQNSFFYLSGQYPDDPLEAAKEHIQWIFKNHHPLPLEEKVQREMKKIISVAEKELV